MTAVTRVPTARPTTDSASREDMDTLATLSLALYSFVAALETGRTCWTAILDAQRLCPVRRPDRGDRRAGP